MLTELLVERTHICEVLTSLLVVLAASHGNQPFSKLPIQFDGFTRPCLFGNPGNLKGNGTRSIISVAVYVGIPVHILLHGVLQPLQSLINVAFIQRDLNEES